jgi:uncharacterized protein YcfL
MVRMTQADFLIFLILALLTGCRKKQKLFESNRQTICLSLHPQLMTQ